MEKLLLTVEEVEEATTICRSKIYTYMASGELRSIKVGRSRRVARTDLIAFIDRLREEQGSYEGETQFSVAAGAA